ncbi:MAG TPA: RluA family pseudouridine synthase [Pseudobdellovibrionaceae bacterium]|nr:RluA family pseudouridine synthase [Pseudobdellovibrionaceae bacterium]
MSKNPSRSQTVEVDGAGTRLDKWLAAWPEVSSRSRAAFLIDENRVLVNARPGKASLVLKTGDEVSVSFPEAQSSELKPLAMSLDILFEDRDLLVVDKPSGLVVHPAAGHAEDTLVNALIAHTDDLAMGFGEERPGIVHRLDKETSGLLVVAKNDSAQASLVSQFQERSIHRLYQAVCHGEIARLNGRIESWIARHPTDRKRFASVLGIDRKILRSAEAPPSAGKWAATTFKRLAIKHGMSFLELKLETGRTHQIRVHLSELGHPLIGDSLYGSDRRLKSIPSAGIREQIQHLSRFLLHARELGFTHPRTAERLMFKAEWPDPARGLLNQWGFL